MPTTTPHPAPSSSTASGTVEISRLPSFQPDLHERAWSSTPHPTLPLLATAHAKSVTVYSLSTLSSHSVLTGGHARSVRTVAWKPGLPPHKLCLVTGSFDATAGLWRWDGDQDEAASTQNQGDDLEQDMTLSKTKNDSDSDSGDNEWEFTLVLEGHDSEVKSCVFSPSGAYLATSSRDKSVWIWEDIGASEADDEWETIAVLNEHEGDVKAVAWCPDVPGRNIASRRCYSPDVLASASYDNTVRIWREDSDAEWVCVAVLEGHEGTVWGLQWEPQPKNDRFPRLMTFSADSTIRVWTLQLEDEDAEQSQDGSGAGIRGALGGIPNTMRRSLREDWTCTAILPKVHERDIYAIAWSADTGLLASTGSDGTIVLYKEEGDDSEDVAVGTDPNASEDQTMTDGPVEPVPTKGWQVLAKVPNAHGPYEVNHITWCRRFDAGCARRGEEEMLVTTGDDGMVQPWEVKSVGPLTATTAS